MADPEDRTRLEGVSPDGRPRRQPPIIDVEAVEVSLDGSRATTAGSAAGVRLRSVGQSLKRILTFLPPVTFSPLKFTIIGSVCVIAAIIAGALWIYLVPVGVDESQRNRARPEAVVPNDAIARIAKPEAAPETQPAQALPPSYPAPHAGEGGAGDLQSRIAALDAKLAPLGDRIAALERAVRDAAAAARAAEERADKAAGLFDVAPASPPPHAQGRQGDDENLAQQRAAVEDIAHRVTALESRQTTLQQKQDGMDRLAAAMTTADKAVRIVTVAVALRSAVERNGPFTAELAAAQSLRLDEKTLASLEPFAATGLPTRNELFRGLSALVPELRRLSMPPGRDLGYFDRLQASAIRMLNIWPVRDEPGDDPATVMSRIEFKLPQQDIDAMLAELDKLPAPARALAQPWRMKALARQEALESVRLMATAALAGLGEPAIRGPSPK